MTFLSLVSSKGLVWLITLLNLVYSKGLVWLITLLNLVSSKGLVLAITFLNLVYSKGLVWAITFLNLVSSKGLVWAITCFRYSTILCWYSTSSRIPSLDIPLNLGLSLLVLTKCLISLHVWPPTRPLIPFCQTLSPVLYSAINSVSISDTSLAYWLMVLMSHVKGNDRLPRLSTVASPVKSLSCRCSVKRCLILLFVYPT